MVSLQTTALLVNSKKVTLSWDGDTYQKLQNINYHKGLEEFMEDSVDGRDYFAGFEDSFFTAEMLLTTDIPTIIDPDSEVDAQGEFKEKTAIISVTDRTAPTTRTFTATAYIRDYDIIKVAKGAAKIRIFFRITQENITVA